MPVRSFVEKMSCSNVDFSDRLCKFCNKDLEHFTLLPFLQGGDGFRFSIGVICSDSCPFFGGYITSARSGFKKPGTMAGQPDPPQPTKTPEIRDYRKPTVKKPLRRRGVMFRGGVG